MVTPVPIPVRVEIRVLRVEGLTLMPCKEFPDLRDQVDRDLHYGMRAVLKSSLVFCYSFLFGLLLIVGQNTANPLFIPSWWKSVSCAHLLFLFRMRLRYANNGLPLSS